MNDFTDDELDTIMEAISDLGFDEYADNSFDIYNKVKAELKRRKELADLDKRADAKKVMSHPQTNTKPTNSGYWFKG